MVKYFLILGVLAMSGCAGFNNKLECPRKDGVSCKSTLEVRDSVEAKLKSGHPAYPGKSSVIKASSLAPVTPSAIRVPERTLQIWLAPHEDSTGAHHGSSVVNAVVVPSHWLTVEGVEHD